MFRQLPRCGAIVLVAGALLVGCQPQQPFYFHERGNLSHYLGLATQIETPTTQDTPLSEVQGASRPLSLANSEPKEIWDLRLEEAMRYALENGKVMRNIGGQVGGPPTAITSAPEQIPTIYDPGLVESNARSGVQQALAAFDTQLTSSLFWERVDRPLNQFDPAAVTSGSIFTDREDQSGFQTSFTKFAATGGQWSLSQNINYDLNRSTGSNLNPLTAAYTINYQAQVRQPLLQGGGVQFNEIAGPNAIPGFNNGVMIARINTDIALANFEAGVRNVVSDVENAYWELYFAYRNLHALVVGRNSALQTWRRIHALYVASAAGGEAEKEAQARQQYFLFRASVEQALNSLYHTETSLRFMMGLAATDGRLIRPCDEPTTAKVAFDWAAASSEALCRSVELREQKWRVKQRELELISAKNYLLPKLDFVAFYRFNGLGPELVDNAGAPLGQFDSAYGNLFDGHYQEYHLGFEATVPLGFRKEMAGVRNAQLGIARERARLQEMELEVSHQVAFAISDMEADLVLAQTNFNRRAAAQREVEAVSAAYDTGKITLDVLLQAQQVLAQAEGDYYRKLVDYNKLITQVHFRKGSLLEYNGVYLAEGPWPGKAYFDARRRARARDAAIYLDYGFTQPKVFSRGPYCQHVGPAAGSDAAAPAPHPTPAPELLPTPAPEPIQAAPNAQEPALPADPPAEAPAQGASAKGTVPFSQSENGDSPRFAPEGTGPAPVPEAQWTRTGNVSAQFVDGNESGPAPSSAATDPTAAGWQRASR